jgi:hypothetical protein
VSARRSPVIIGACRVVCSCGGAIGIEYARRVFAEFFFKTPALSLPQFGPQLKHKKKNRSWEDGADDSDDMVVWASHACQSLMAAALADDRHRNIKSQWCS